MKYITLLTTILLVFISQTVLSQNEFITVWKTDIVDSENKKIYIPGVGIDYSIVWEDVNNSSSTGTIKETHSATIEFPAPGTYRVKISDGEGSFTRFWSTNSNLFKSSRDCLLEIEQWGNIKWSNFNEAFKKCSNLDVTATDAPDLSNVTDLNGMFNHCTSLVGNSNFGDWVTTNITEMSGMFAATQFNQDITSWETGNVEYFAAMFGSNAVFNQPIGVWDVSKAVNFYHMFGDATSFNQPLNSWDVSNATNSGDMFLGATSFNQPLNNWDVSSVTTFDKMFSEATSFNQPLGNWTFKSGETISTSSMFKNTAIDCFNWDATLIGWADNANTPNNITIDASLDNHKYSSNEAVTARNYLRNTKGWRINGDTYDAGCNTTLGVDYANITASIKNNILNVSWETLSETNNAYFEVEISTDGKHFQPIGTVSSLSSDGNSSAPLQYHFSTPLNKLLAIGLPLLALFGFNIAKKRKRFLMMPIALCFVCFFYSCSKDGNSIDETKKTHFVRIAQTDINGDKSYSKILKVIKE